MSATDEPPDEHPVPMKQMTDTRYSRLDSGFSTSDRYHRRRHRKRLAVDVGSTPAAVDRTIGAIEGAWCP